MVELFSGRDSWRVSSCTVQTRPLWAPTPEENHPQAVRGHHLPGSGRRAPQPWAQLWVRSEGTVHGEDGGEGTPSTTGRPESREGKVGLWSWMGTATPAPMASL